MLDAKQAAKIAEKYYEDISSEQVKLSVEEIEFDDEGYWLITLGISDNYVIGSLGKKPMNYKVFKIHAESGEVKSMKIREMK